MVTDAGFAAWDPLEYLREYFPPFIDDEPAIRFVVEESRRIANNPIIVDVGCGPTVCYWLAAAPCAAEIHVADYLHENLDQLRLWVDRGPGMYDWRPYTELILKYEGRPARLEEIAQREAAARRKTSRFLTCDVTAADPLGPDKRHSYDCLMSLFCADGITADKDNWRRYMGNIVSLLRPGGFFIGAAMLNCSHYAVGPHIYPAANVSERDFEAFVKDAGFDLSTIRIEIARESRRVSRDSQSASTLREEYDSVILCAGFLMDKGGY